MGVIAPRADDLGEINLISWKLTIVAYRCQRASFNSWAFAAAVASRGWVSEGG